MVTNHPQLSGLHRSDLFGALVCIWAGSSWPGVRRSTSRLSLQWLVSGGLSFFFYLVLFAVWPGILHIILHAFQETSRSYYHLKTQISKLEQHHVGMKSSRDGRYIFHIPMGELKQFGVITIFSSVFFFHCYTCTNISPCLTYLISNPVSICSLLTENN